MQPNPNWALPALCVGWAAFILGCGGEFEPERTNQSEVQKPRDEPHNAETQKSFVEWIPHTKAARQGDFLVEIEAVNAGGVDLKDVMGKTSSSKDKLLQIRLRVHNFSKNRKVTFRGWGRTDSSTDGAAQLEDEFGNKYSTSYFGSTTRVVGQSSYDSLYPGKSLSDAVVFELPVPTAQELRLTLPAAAFGGEGALRFRIPTSALDHRTIDSPVGQTAAAIPTKPNAETKSRSTGKKNPDIAERFIEQSSRYRKSRKITDNDYPIPQLDDEALSPGEIGEIRGAFSIEIQQVVDDDSFLVAPLKRGESIPMGVARIEDLSRSIQESMLRTVKGSWFFLDGIKTKGLSDGQKLKPALYEVVETRSYTSVNGAKRTLPVLKEVDVGIVQSALADLRKENQAAISGSAMTGELQEKENAPGSAESFYPKPNDQFESITAFAPHPYAFTEEQWLLDFGTTYLAKDRLQELESRGQIQILPRGTQFQVVEVSKKPLVESKPRTRYCTCMVTEDKSSRKVYISLSLFNSSWMKPVTAPLSPEEQAEKNERAAVAKLRLAQQFIDRGDKAKASRWLSEIIEEYPGTEAAKEAKAKLDD